MPANREQQPQIFWDPYDRSCCLTHSYQILHSNSPRGWVVFKWSITTSCLRDKSTILMYAKIMVTCLRKGKFFIRNHNAHAKGQGSSTSKFFWTYKQGQCYNVSPRMIKFCNLHANISKGGEVFLETNNTQTQGQGRKWAKICDSLHALT